MYDVMFQSSNEAIDLMNWMVTDEGTLDEPF